MSKKRIKNQLNLFREIIVDNFAGGGGASTGIEYATGISVDVAINHSKEAIAMHKANHPDTEHYCESVWDVDPVEVVKGRPVALCWLSPDCKHFSKAKGGKPVNKRIRGLAWVAVRWAAKVRPRVIVLENVEEFQTWGPVRDGQPVPHKKGATFRRFVDSLRQYGYEVEWKELKACDYGAPTIRNRFFLIARCDGKPITWPQPTHGDPNSLEVQSGRLKPWRTAAEIIDWSLDVPSIFDRSKPLVDNTLRRIARGIKKFVIEAERPFVLPRDNPQTASFVTSYYTETSKSEVRGVDLNSPLHTVTAGGNRFGLVTAFIAKHYGGGYSGAGTDLKKPLSTVTTVDHNALVTAHIMQNFTGSVGQPLETPLWTTTGVNKASLVTAFLTKYYGSDVGQSLDVPLHTVTTRDRFGLIKVHGSDFQIVDIGMRMLQPHELFAAQGFPDGYIIDKDHEGNAYSKAKQIERCGNAVPPPFAEAIVRANLPELCVEPGDNKYKQRIG